MKYDSVTHSIGKRVVGKQNMIPLLRDCADDERDVRATVDLDRQRVTGVVQSYSNDGVVIQQECGRIRARWDRILATRVDEVLS